MNPKLSGGTLKFVGAKGTQGVSMGGDDDKDLEAAAAAEALAVMSSGDEADTLSRIRALSDAELVRYYSLLSDTRYVVNVPSLSLLEAEIRARDLPIGRQH